MSNGIYFKIAVFGNNSKTVSNIKNLTWGKNDQHIKIYLHCNFEVNLITHLGVSSILSNSGHVGWCTASPDTILKLDTLVMIQRRRFLKKFTTYDGRQVMAIAHMTLWVR
jgi:hypothetical protein